MEYTFLKKLKSGETCYCMMAYEFMTPGFLTIIQQCRADFLIIDTEQSGWGIETIRQQVA